MSVQDLINAIATGNATETQDSFQAVMAEKISARLDSMRVEVAQNMFAAEEVQGLDEISFGVANSAYQERLKRGHTATKDGEDDKNFEKAYDTKQRVKKKFGSSGEKELEKRELPYDKYSK